jgi:hypothetical protein
VLDAATLSIDTRGSNTGKGRNGILTLSHTCYLFAGFMLRSRTVNEEITMTTSKTPVMDALVDFVLGLELAAVPPAVISRESIDDGLARHRDPRVGRAAR